MINSESAHDKAKFLQDLLLQKFHEIFPEKTRKVNSDDQPWISHKLKTIDRARKREYSKHRRSEKWKILNSDFKKGVKCAKKSFYQKMMSELMSKNSSQWYSSVKRITSHDQQKFDKIIVPELNNFSDEEQANKIADHFAKIPNQYNQLRLDDIHISQINDKDIPQFKEVEIWMLLSNLKTNKSTIQTDISARIYKEFAAHLAEPLTHVYNTSLTQGQYPKIYKYEISTPVPKKYPVESMEQLRNISGLLIADNIFEKLLSEMIISDMKKTADVAQFGNQKQTSIQHYLIKMIHKITTAVDNNARRDIFAVVASMVDWNSAFVRQCPKLGILSFQKNGVRNSLIPLLVSYFQERHQSVKWRGFTTSPKMINGGGPQGATLGILEFLSQTNNSADCVGPEERFKFVDDLTVLEIVNLLTVGLCSLNIKNQVPNDIKEDNQFIHPENLKSQEYLNEISAWTDSMKMKINTNKTKIMLFNFTHKYQFSTRLELNGQVLDTVSETKLLGTILTNDLRWDKNTENIVKKAYGRMELLRKMSSFGAPKGDLKKIYLTFIRSHCEQSSSVWHSGLTQQNIDDIERIQKVSLKIILKGNYLNYENALKILDLSTLEDRRNELSLTFAQKCLKNPKMKGLFPPNNRTHDMTPRHHEHFQVFRANTERMKKSPIISMQKLLNKNIR